MSSSRLHLEHDRPSRRRSWGRHGRLHRTLVALGLAVVGVGAVSGGAHASVGSDDFRAGEVYHGDFPDPSVMRVGSTYYAFATTTGGKLLPEMTSPDLKTWTAHPSSTGRWWQNDALLAAPVWAKQHYAHGRWRTSTWAPSVAPVQGGYVAAYAAPVSLDPQRMCVTLAHAKSPLGPFVDSSARPFVCGRDQGSIDPKVYTDSLGVIWLLWKSEGIAGVDPTRIYVQQLNATATEFAPNSTPHTLLSTAQPWEGNVIENPSMVAYGGRTYLFYSANQYADSSYAIGYAECATTIGPCTRLGTVPLLATGGSVAGPGGQDAFVGRAGRLRLAYAAWDVGHVGYPTSTACRATAYGCNQRRLHVARLEAAEDGTLRVVDRG